MTEDEIKRRCAVRGWQYNNFTAYVVEMRLSIYTFSNLLGIAMPVMLYWCKHDKLSAPVQAFFLTMRKIYMMYGIRIDDLF